MIAVLNNQNINKRNSRGYIYRKYENSTSLKKYKNKREKKAFFNSLILLKRSINIFLILTFSFAIFFMLYMEAGKLKPKITSLSFPKDNSVENLLLQSTIPDHESRGTVTKKLPPAVIRNLKIVKYTVRQRDTLSSIALKYRINLGTIISYNNIRNAQRLSIGTTLEIPNQNGLKYKVKRGDSLSGIAKKFSVPLKEILDWNNLSTSVIQPGQELFIAGAAMKTNDLNRVLGKLFIYPTRGRLTSPFGMRHDPFTGLWRFHNGVDLANRIGTPVVAAMSGTVAMVGINPTYGRYIILRHADGFQTLYAHLSRVLVSRGRRISQNQVIGKMGTTGYSTGSHLHFSIFKNGKPVDPLKYLH